MNFAGAARPGELVPVRIEGATSTTLRGASSRFRRSLDRAHARLGRAASTSATSAGIRRRPAATAVRRGRPGGRAREALRRGLAGARRPRHPDRRRPPDARRAQRDAARRAADRGRPRVRAAGVRLGGLGRDRRGGRRARPTRPRRPQIVYLEFLERFREPFAAAIREVADAPEGGVLVHCQGGKDRTGLVAALLLRLAGVAARATSAPTTRSRGENLREEARVWIDAAPRSASGRAASGCRRRTRRVDGRRARASSSAGTATSRGYLRDARPRRRDDRARPQPPAPVTLLALFGPTASGKSAVAGRSRARRRRADLRRLGAGLPRAADPDEPGRPAAAAGRDLAARPRGLGRGVPAARARGDRRGARRRPRAGRRRRDGALPAGGADRRSSIRRRRSRARGSAGRRSTTQRGRSRRTRCSPSATRRRRRACTRTTAGASCGRSSWPRPGRRSPATASGRRSGACRRSSWGSTCRARSSRAGSSGARGRCSSAGWRRRCGVRSPSRSPRPRARCSGLREVAELPREQAIERMVVRTRRFAAYQRKWMRRIPGLVSVRADRPPEETAAAIVDLARARERLPSRRAS